MRETTRLSIAPWWVLVTLACVSLFRASPATVCAAERSGPIFERDVVPILKAYCWKCHGGEGRQKGLDMRSLPLLLRGGGGGPAIVRGSAEKSRIIQRIVQGEMPPAGQLRPTEAHLAVLREWLDQGAAAEFESVADDAPREPVASTHWSFQPPRRSALPELALEGAAVRARSPVDAWILQKLDSQGLTLAPEADRRVLARRLSFDLTGLPPDDDLVQSLVADDAPDATDRLIDRLFASPRYGERWGRHWLDAAGYADAIGTDNDASIIEEREGIWRYRDWVVSNVNRDKPYDRFLLEQLAGDELVDWRSASEFTPEIRDLLVATGFLRLAADVTYAPELNTSDIRHQVVYDTLQILATNLLGLTVHCAQCHDHKFDPIKQKDYYSLLGTLLPAYDPQEWRHSKERFLADVPEAERRRIDEHNRQVDEQIAKLTQQVTAARQPFGPKVRTEKLARLPAGLGADLEAALAIPAGKRNAVQSYLAEKLGPLIAVSPQEIDQALDEPTRHQTAKWNAEINALASTRRSYGKIQALWDVNPSAAAFVYFRGDYQSPRETVRAGAIAAASPATAAFEFPSFVPRGVAGTVRDSSQSGPVDAPTSHHRTELARWLTHPDHPLTARVLVNRLWQQLFGRGIVETPDNFGASGAAPSHLELLDWLALEFVRGEWSMKRAQRLLLSSATYRQASSLASGPGVALGEQRDPENRLLWRMPLRRLEAEVIRDSMLAVADTLDMTTGGAPVPLKEKPDGSVEIDASHCKTKADPFRRSLYVFCRRNYQLSELSVFDQPVVAHNCTRRTSNAVVLQSLAMLNGRFGFEQSERLADRVRRSAGGDPNARVAGAFRFAFARAPDEAELALARQLLASQSERYRAEASLAAQDAESGAADRALADLCQMLLNGNEFLYVE